MMRYDDLDKILGEPEQEMSDQSLRVIAIRQEEP
jgi:hypothetical protein